jgi:hypothetical protein
LAKILQICFSILGKLVAFYHLIKSGWMLKLIVLLAFFLLLSFIGINAEGQELQISGYYQGKNLYIQNPYDPVSKDFCTFEVFLNERKIIEKPKTSAYEIDLSSIPANAQVHIKIIHKSNCEPKIINPQVLKVDADFRFNAFSIDDNIIRWITQGEKPHGKYFIEQFLDGRWTITHTVQASGDFRLNEYKVEINPGGGSAKYRVKLLMQEGNVYYSKELDYTPNVKPVTFYPTRVSDKITLSRETNYEVVDPEGTVLYKGKGKEIMVKDLASGLYYLKIENRSEKFFKK